MRFGVLGRLAVWREDGTEVQISGPARRQLLAALLCRAGSAVGAATLIDDLWGAAAPRTALGTLRSHMARLRDDLGRGEAGELVRSEGDGYRLTIDVDAVDAVRFERLAAQAAATADAHAAIAGYDEALALWRDEAYIEFGDAAFAVGERIRLAELRALARERRTDLALSTGAAADVIGDLEQRVRTEPYRERGWEQLALALYRSGRQADGLAACRRAREVLIEDLGVDPGEGLRTLEERLLRQDPELLRIAPARSPVAVLDRCPYLGLAGYEEQDAGLFVGRERLTSVLAGRLADQSIVVVTGASGVGKSSLVRAGLVPALRAGALPGSAAWRVEVRTPADGVLDLGAARLPDLIVLDQAEELFTTLAADAGNQLVGRLTEYVDDRAGRLVIVLRSDYYGRLADLPTLAPFAEKTAVLVGPMRADELRRALIEPAAAAGLRLEPDLVETVMEDVAGQAEPLPLLSEAMVRTWQRRDGDLLTLEGYRAAGELAGAVEAAAEECYARLGEEERRAARHLLVRMAARSGSGWIRRPIARAGALLTTEEQAALGALVSARLAVTSEERIEVAHDALLGHWPRLRDWLAERTLAADLLAHLDQAATTWQGSGRHAADLYRGPRLTAALDWRTDHPEDVSPAESEFLDASARAAEAELEAARAQAAREARGRRNIRRVAVGLAATVLLAVAGGAIALHERGTARSEATRAREAAIAADARRVAALALTAPDIATSSELAVAAWRVQDSPETRNALLTIVQRNNSALWRMPFQLRLLRMQISADGRTAWLMDRDRYIHVVDLSRRKELAEYRLPAQDVAGVTPDGKTLIVFGSDAVPNDPNGEGRVTALNARTGAVQYVFPAKGQEPNSGGVPPVLTGNGRWLVVPGPSDDHTPEVARLCDLQDPTATPRTIRLSAAISSMAAGQTTVAIQTADHRVRLLRAPSFRAVWQGRITDGDISALAPKGNQLAVSGAAVRLITTAGRGARAVTLPGADSPNGMQYRPDGRRLAVGTNGGAVEVYDTASGAQVANLPGEGAAVLAVGWAQAAGGEALYSAGLDSQLVSWDLSGGSRIRRDVHTTLPPPNDTGQYGNTVIGDGPVEDGTYPNAGGAAERAWVLDLTSGRMRFWPLHLALNEYVFGTSATTDGRLGLFSVWNSKSNAVETTIWNLRTLRQIGRLRLPAVSDGYTGQSGVIDPNGKFAVESIDHEEMGVFAVPSGRLLHRYAVHFRDEPPNRFDIYPSKFDPRGGVLIYAIDNGPPAPPPPGSNQKPSTDTAPKSSRIGLFDPHTGRLTAQARVGPESITAVGWSHNKKWLAIGTVGGILQLYDTRNLHRITDAGVVEGGYILTASFSPDDTTLVFGSTGGVGLWSVPSLTRIGTPVRSPTGQTGWWYAWFRTNGDINGIAPTESDVPSNSAVRDTQFTMPGRPAEWAAEACSLAHGTLSRAQWTRYFGTAPYQDVCPKRG